MKDFAGKIAVITGGGTGMGRELCVALAQAGTHIAMCDVSVENMAETASLCQTAAPSGTKITTFQCDVAEESQVLAFRDAVAKEHATDHINLLFNNAGIGGGGSFVSNEKANWEKTFAVCWYGVYYNARAFMPMLVASDEGHMINTSSVNGFWATIGPTTPHTAYCAAKFAVKGFTEALITDLKINAPHVQASVVMPGHIGTSIAINSGKVLGTAPEDLRSSDIAAVREQMVAAGGPVGNEDDEHIRDIMRSRGEAFRDNAPTSALQAANIILDGVRRGDWRILVGDDAQQLDQAVRKDPTNAYEPSFLAALMQEGVFETLIQTVGDEN